MSPEMIVTLSGSILLGIGMLAGFLWTAQRLDAAEQHITARLDEMALDLGTRLDNVAAHRPAK